MFLLWFLLLLQVCVPVCSTSASPSQHHTRVRIIEVEDDYDDINTHTTHSPRAPGLTISRAIRRPCDYDPCAVQTSPCDVISAQTGCLCPGLTGPQERPEPPDLRELRPGSGGGVSVLWCAPRSTVTHYEVSLKDEKSSVQTFGEHLRSGVIPGLKFGQIVCVAAGNEAGLSEQSCAQYEAPQVDHAALSAGVIGGSIGFFLLLLALSVVLWRKRTCRKGGMGDAEGLGNPSYSNDGVL
ncbi:LRRN4 C-terminal-like protein [Danio rerio]|uniref:LRRN4 C-terminal-like protein n=1 Tax=Danio rerio TaxID=7955 RepID=A0A8M9QGI4_DANRE|nr:LRRN4 C-terminal-like protein [Danio rerio]|eukprot:XP_021336754.1 LRRN4 C-terminal-like protein [Danio rerio]